MTMPTKIPSFLLNEKTALGIPRPKHVELEPVSCYQEKAELKYATAYIVRNQDTQPFLAKCHGGAYVGRPKTAAQLWRLLLRQKMIPVIKTNYSVPGRVLRAVRDLLQRATDINERNCYIIGVEETLFDALHDYVKKQTGKANTDASDGTGSLEPWQIIHTRVKHQYVPPELRDCYIGHSERAEFVRHLIACAAKCNSNVLIVGESGTGKEVVARAIHDFGPRRTQHFEAVNCAGIPDQLLESELFGHIKGSFPGALFDKTGKWQQADHGTLFLDEVSELSLSHQAKILRAIEDKKITPIGAYKTLDVDARIIAATNRDLPSMVKKGTFREDLLSRLHVFLIPVPALHEHPEDIAPLANRFWHDITNDPKAELSTAVILEFQNRRLPGNARDIRSALRCVYDLVGQEGMDAQFLRAVLDHQNGPKL